MKNTAIVLAGGSGSRMNSKIKKQYLLIDGKPVLWYSLNLFENCSRIDDVILVCGKGDTEYCRNLFQEKYGFRKIVKAVEGGKERYHSVYEGLKAAQDCGNILIHDGARPFADEAMIDRILDCLETCEACVAAVPVKDTIKRSDSSGFAAQTIPREELWQIQTPQAFHYSMIRKAYDELIRRENAGGLEVKITDDAMTAEYICGKKSKLIEGSYNNIKITTPEDLVFAEAIAASLKTKT